jgi:hypothetical protein
MPNFKSASDSLVHPLWMDDIPRVYLAGKIHKGVHWRSELTGGGARPLSVLDPKTALDLNYFELIDSVAGLPHYIAIGPFFVSCDHGCAHGTGLHGSAGCESFGQDRNEIRRAVHTINCQRIIKAHFVFAFINEIDCFGTISEIGFAAGRRVPVHLCLGENLTKAQVDDLWFVRSFAATMQRGRTFKAFSRAIRSHRLARYV